MRMVWLMLCTIWLIFLASPVFAQLPEPGFDPTPVSLPRSLPGAMRTVTAHDLLPLRQVYGVSISPDGRKVAFVVGQADDTTNSYRSGLFVASMDSAEPKCLGSAGTPHWDAIHQWIPEGPQWAENSGALTYRMRMRTTDSWQVWSWDEKSDRLAQLTHVPGDVVELSAGGF